MIAYVVAAIVLRCVARGELPDPACTPGAVDPSAFVCGQPTRERRHVDEAMRRRVFAEYDVPWAERSAYEVDHLVPLCLGGSNELANLWPERSHAEKDRVEARLCRRVCAGEVSLDWAQRVMMIDWRQAR
jgi:hypothetical protein